MAVMYIVKLAVSYSGAVITIASIWQLMIFLSYLPGEGDTPTTGDNLVWNLFVDVSLLCIFIFQHSFMAHPVTKSMVAKCGLQDLDRSIYVIMSSIAVQLTIYYWKPISWVSLWHINLIDSKLVWWLFTLIHLYMWSIIYTGSLMDPFELLGIKQVVNSIDDLQHPVTYKSRRLTRYYQHMRHPSFVGLFVIFWVYPYMRLDRLLLSLLWTLYMMVMWRVDDLDYRYLHEKLFQKKTVL